MKGIVYFDEVFGVIRGVTFNRQQSMDADFCSIEVDDDIAIALMTGAEQVHEWTVGYSDDGSLVLKPIASFRVNLLDGDGPWSVMQDEPTSGPVQIHLQIDDRGWAKATLTTASPTIVLIYPKSYLTFTLVARGDPDSVLSRMEVSVDELNRHRSTIQTYQATLGREFDILAPPVSPMSFRAERVARVRGSVQLASVHRDTLRVAVRCEKNQVDGLDRHGGLVIRKQGAKLVLSLAGDGGVTYARENTSMQVAVCSRYGPDHLISTERVNIADLDAGKKITIDIPRGLKTEDFDVYTELVYFHTFLVQ